jgi:hypothetical protein
MPGPVYCVAENGIWLAIGSGKVVQLVKQVTIGAVSRLPGNYANPSNLQLLGKEPGFFQTPLSSQS